MTPRYKQTGVSTVLGEIDHTTSGGFIAIASNGDLDRDNERILPGCMVPLPASVPVHLDHTMRASDVVARARPYYRGDQLMVEATFSTDHEAQRVRAKVADGTLDSLSIVFRGLQWENIDGVRTCVRGELLAVDIVSVAALPSARILSMRSFNPKPGCVGDEVHKWLLMLELELELNEAERILKAARRDEVRRTEAEIRQFLRSL